MVGYLVFLTISTGLFALFALGLNLQWGFAGLINFGHVAFMTIGAYTTVLLSSMRCSLNYCRTNWGCDRGIVRITHW